MLGNVRLAPGDVAIATVVAAQIVAPPANSRPVVALTLMEVLRHVISP
jgi:hypothetical protein